MPYPVVHFEIPADDVARARNFYQRAFGWKIRDPRKTDYFMIETRSNGAQGINGGLMQRSCADQSMTNYIAVKSIETALEKVEKAGGTVCMPKTEVGANMGWIAAFRDTESNLLGFYQAPKVPASKKSAKKAPPKK